MNQCFGLQYTVFSHLSLALNVVQVIEGKNKCKDLKGNKNYFEFAGFSSYLHVGFELSRVKLQ